MVQTSSSRLRGSGANDVGSTRDSDTGALEGDIQGAGGSAEGSLVDVGAVEVCKINVNNQTIINYVLQDFDDQQENGNRSK